MGSAYDLSSPFALLDSALSGAPAGAIPSSREALLEALPVPLIVTDERGRTLYANRAFSSLLGCGADFPLGKELASLLISQEDDAEGPARGEERELMLTRPDGKLLPVRELRASVEHGGRKFVASVLQDLSKRQLADERALRIAYDGVLTGLPGQDRFMAALTQELHRLFETEGHTFSVVLLDVDRFKSINERFGADVADKVLLEVSERTKTILHSVGTIFRTGGDEVAAILKGISSRDYVESLLDRLQKLISLPIWIAGNSIFPSACITAILNVPKDLTALQVMGRLSGAMKVAKKRGLGYALFVEPAEEGAEERGPRRESSVATEIRASLISSRFVPYLQPIYHMATMQLVGFETLARWKHPDSGVLPPSDFISDAEEAGLITAIDEAIVSQSIAAMEGLVKRHPDVPFWLSANASSLSLRDPSFLPFIQGELRKTSFPAERFVLEITEDILIEDLPKARSYLDALKELGVRVVLDDFGKGWSSLRYISQLPIDGLKIDTSFIDQLLRSKTTMGFVKHIIETARQLGLDVVAEGVESKAQKQWLAEFGVDGQGYFFSPPLSMDKVDEFLDDASVFGSLLGQQEQD
ncbi:MAG: GGDEF domain-containing protein [Synergistaceae bacterium]|nr:GGDEF domain-containing protein [Synergistaceae bacterium]